MNFYSIAARLLDYPDAELMDHLGEILEITEADRSISEKECEVIAEMVAWMSLHDLIGIQEVYVQTFDTTPEHDLHLTHHLFGDDRGRGPALVDLAEHYKGAGLEVSPGEIPDYLPLILEFISTLDEVQACVFLGDAAKVLVTLGENLVKAGSPYAQLIRIIEHRGHLAQAA